MLLVVVVNHRYESPTNNSWVQLAAARWDLCNKPSIAGGYDEASQLYDDHNLADLSITGWWWLVQKKITNWLVVNWLLLITTGWLVVKIVGNFKKDRNHMKSTKCGFVQTWCTPPQY